MHCSALQPTSSAPMANAAGGISDRLQVLRARGVPRGKLINKQVCEAVPMQCCPCAWPATEDHFDITCQYAVNASQMDAAQCECALGSQPR